MQDENQTEIRGSVNYPSKPVSLLDIKTDEYVEESE
jgi:hypothetical protein